MSQFRYLVLWLSMIFFAIQITLAQTAKESIFGDVEKMLRNAQEQGAEYLSPTFFKQAMEDFKEANDYYINNESTRDIREKLTEAQRNCARALEVIKLAVITLKDPIIAREDAQKVEANIHAKELFDEAEEKFYNAAREVENDDLNDAREVGNEAEELYRKAELKSIKNNILGEARSLVQQANETEVEEYAPQTIARARALLNEIEDHLTNNRYATKDAGTKAMECVYQAKHAIFLAQEIKGLKEDELNWEKLILQYEDILTGFATKFNESPGYENGMRAAIDLISAKIDELQNENKELNSENALLKEEYTAVKAQASSSSEELAKKKEREEKFQKVKSMFSSREAIVVFDGENLVVRLHGLSFQSGQSVIQPEYFSLLTKVQNAIKVFPQKHILIEGHTDSRGNPQTNKRLSEDRAQAVREYLIANMGKDREEITSIGYGSAKPVASNETSDGRALNRRIDIVINMAN
jgi:outer membrane protein OmpA-like peptidoglycan-associated protein